MSDYSRTIKYSKYSKLTMISVILGIIIAVFNNINSDSNYFDNYYYIITNIWFIFFLIVGTGLSALSIKDYFEKYDTINLRTDTDFEKNKIIFKNILILFGFIIIAVCIASLFYSRFNFHINETDNYFMSQLLYIFFNLIKLFAFMLCFSEILFTLFLKYSSNLIMALYLIFDISIFLIPSFFKIVQVDDLSSIPIFVGYCFQRISYSNFMLEVSVCTVHLIIFEIISIIITKKMLRTEVSKCSIN